MRSDGGQWRQRVRPACGREVAGFLGAVRAGAVRSLADIGARVKDLQEEDGEVEFTGEYRSDGVRLGG